MSRSLHTDKAAALSLYQRSLRAPVTLPKRGVSEMLSYALVLVLVISLSIGVYMYLQLQSPKVRESCTREVILIVDPAESTCVFLDDKTVGLSVLLENRGRKSITGAYVRIGAPGENIRTLLNSEKIFFSSFSNEPVPALLPGKTIRYSATRSDLYSLKEGENILEVQPVIGTGKQTTICEQSALTQRIICSKLIALP